MSGVFFILPSNISVSYGLLSYYTDGRRTDQEQDDLSFRSRIANNAEAMDQYDTVLLGCSN